MTPNEAAAPPEAPISVPLNPPAVPPVTVPNSRRLGIAGVILAFLAAALAFLLASSPSRNSDVWLHLASGRAIASGRSPLDAESFLHTSQGNRWVNSNWLYDLLLYLGFQTLGGTGLVVLNACLAALLALLLLALGRSGKELALAAAFTCLSVLALGPWLLLQPLLLSCLFLAITLFLLEQGARAAETGKRFPWYWAILPLVFALWANLDQWFLLGPASAALYALGLLLAGQAKTAGRLSLFIVVGFAASLVNPFTFQAWTLPDSLRAFNILTGEPVENLLAFSPYSQAYFRGLGGSPSGIAYYALSLLGMLAFAQNYGGRGWRWAPLWLGLLGLSAWHATAIPFFAVLAGPACALNFSEFGKRLKASQAPEAPQRWQALAQWVAVAAGLVLVIAAWPGWLQGKPPYGRRSWSLEVDEPLQKAGEQLAAWRRDGVLGEKANGFNLSPEIAHYSAWFGDGERGFFDSRARLNAGETAKDFSIVRRGLLGQTDPKEKDADWRQVLRNRGVNHVVLHDSAAQPIAPAVFRMAAAPKEWAPQYLRGGVAIFSWLDPQSGDKNPLSRMDLGQRAIRPDAEDKAPLEGPSRGPESARWWQTFVNRAPAKPPEREEAMLYLTFFDAQRTRYRERDWLIWRNAMGAAQVGAPTAFGGGPLALGAQTIFGLDWVRIGWQGFTSQRDDGDPGLLLLAIRSARRTLRDNPDDARSYFYLGEAYFRLGRSTRERAWQRRLPLLSRLRAVQALHAYNQVLKLDPNRPEARGRLARLYQDGGYLDLALDNLNAVVRMTRSRGPQPGQDAEAFKEMLRALELERDGLAEEVQRRRDHWDTAAANRPVLQQAQEAANSGLPGQALKTLLKSDIAAFGPPGARLELVLFLGMGKIDQAQRWMEEAERTGKSGDESKKFSTLRQELGFYDYHLIRNQIAAAIGNYADADRELVELGNALANPGGKKNIARAKAALDVADAVLQAPAFNRSPALQAPSAFIRWYFISRAEQIMPALRAEADLEVLRGILLMESGQIAQSKAAFQRALALWKSDQAVEEGSGLDFSGRPIAQECLQWLAGDN
jgi:hypothetical protein